MRCMSRLLFWLRRFRLAAQGWHPQRLVRFFLIAPSITLAEVRLPALSLSPCFVAVQCSLLFQGTCWLPHLSEGLLNKDETVHVTQSSWYLSS